MIKNFKIEEYRKRDIQYLVITIVAMLFITWLCTPPGNKFAQLCFYGNKTQYFIAKIKGNSSLIDYKFHRNNAVYLAQMYQKKQALIEMRKAVELAPNFLNESEFDNLYRDSAKIKIFLGEYKSALDDYIKVKKPDFLDRLPLAMLYKVNGNNKLALKQCNAILLTDYNAYSGYACFADIYSNAGRNDIAVNLYNLLINNNGEKATYYADRAYYHKLNGYQEGADRDLNKAKELDPYGNIQQVEIIKQALKPKHLELARYQL